MISVPRAALHVCERLRAAGHEAWLVGGAVRDALMGREASDWDIATSARPEAVQGLFERVIATGLRHGTVTVLVEGAGYEVTTFRADGDYSDGRRPDGVEFVRTIGEDLARRDFTVNAVAFDPQANAFCDPFGGVEDAKRRILRAVGDPQQRFAEDGLRVLRAARFAATLGFELDPATLAAIRPSLPTFARVAVERVRAEWMKAMSAEQPSRAFRVMAETGLLEATVPEFMPSIGCVQNRYHAYDVWEHTLRVLDACPPDPVLRLAAVFHDIAKPATKGRNPKNGDVTFYNHEEVGADVADGILARMKFSNEERTRATHLVRHHLLRYQAGFAAAAVRRWVRRVGKEHVASLCALARADIAGKGPAAVEMKSSLVDELEERIANMEIHEPIVTDVSALAISGRDVIAALGTTPGPEVGRILRALLEVVTEHPEANTRDALLSLVRRGVPVKPTGPDC